MPFCDAWLMLRGMKRIFHSALILLLGSLSAFELRADPNHSRHHHHHSHHSPRTVIVNIRDWHGRPLPITLRVTRNGFTGPRGETYRRLPSARELERIYGHRPVGGGQANQSSPYRVELRGRQVILTSRGRPFRTLQAAEANVEGYEFFNQSQLIGILSDSRHRPAVIELFSLATGQRISWIYANRVNISSPPWARAMASFYRPHHHGNHHDGNHWGQLPAQAPAPYAVNTRGNQLIISRRGRVVRRFTTVGSTIRGYRFHENGSRIAVRSSGRRNSIIEYFDISSGHRLNWIDASRVNFRSPFWAQGFTK